MSAATPHCIVGGRGGLVIFVTVHQCTVLLHPTSEKHKGGTHRFATNRTPMACEQTRTPIHKRQSVLARCARGMVALGGGAGDYTRYRREV